MPIRRVSNAVGLLGRRHGAPLLPFAAWPRRRDTARPAQRLQAAIPSEDGPARASLLVRSFDAELPAPGERRREPGPLLRDAARVRRACRRGAPPALSDSHKGQRSRRLRSAVQCLYGELASAYGVPRPDDGHHPPLLPSLSRGVSRHREGEARRVASRAERLVLSARHRLPFRVVDRARMLLCGRGDDDGRGASDRCRHAAGRCSRS